MMLTYFFLGAGLGLLGLLLFLFLRLGNHVRGTDDPLAALASLDTGAASTSHRMGERIFSPDDWEFISQTAPSFRRQFLRERRAIGLSWIAQRKATAGAVMGLHRLIARSHASLDPVMELKLAAHYLVFVSVCTFAQSLIWLRGPFVARQTVSSLIAMGDRMQAVSNTILREVEPAFSEAASRNRVGVG